MQDTQTELLQLIQRAYDIDPATIDPHKPLAEFGLDSLSLAELLFAIEDHFRIVYPDARTGVQTVAELVEVVDQTRALGVAA